MHTDVYPFSAIVGQEQLKLALILNAINPGIGGVLIRGEKGTAKSTAVRALASLLPDIDVLKGCPFECDPEEQENQCNCCGWCGSDPGQISRRVRVVTLPLNATEDRVAGGIDFDQAIRKGRREIQPGLLARAHRGILYVDEVNLLDDHIADIILDAAASGQNVIEREGISFRHPSCFILVGTMNPEEGELRPQLLDRFGLCVEVHAVSDKEERILMMERRESYDANPADFLAAYENENALIARMIGEARQRLAGIRMPEHLRFLCAQLCVEKNVAGHRADLVMEQAARAFAAWQERSEITSQDIREIAAMSLLHRTREASPPPPPPEHDHNHQEPPEENQNETQENKDQQAEEQQTPHEAEDSRSDEMQPRDDEKTEPESNPEEKERNQREDVLEKIFDVGQTFKVRKFAAPRDRIFRRGSGRRSRTRIAQKQGRYVKSTMSKHTGDVALDATLRAAAPYQMRRAEEKNGLVLCLRPEDIREKIREKRIGNFLLFVVDASGSMGARGRMVASKGAIMSLLLDAYQKRDRVAMVSFRKDDAAMNLPPTSSIELAANLLREMPVGGRTPLSAGLARAYEVLRNYLLREPDARPIAIIVTDGKSNVALGRKKPFDEAFELAVRVSLDERIRFIVVDTETQGLINFGLARKLARAMNAQYFKTEDMKADTLLNIVRGEA